MKRLPKPHKVYSFAMFKNYCKNADQESAENLALRAHPSLVYKNEKLETT